MLLPHHAVKKFAGDDGSLMSGCGDEFGIVVGFNGKESMFCVVFDEGSGNGNGIFHFGHTGVVNVNVFADGEALFCIEHSVHELGSSDLHPLDEDVGAEQIGEGGVEGTDAVGGMDGEGFRVGCGGHDRSPWMRCWQS